MPGMLKAAGQPVEIGIEWQAAIPSGDLTVSSGELGLSLLARAAIGLPIRSGTA